MENKIQRCSLSIIIFMVMTKITLTHNIENKVNNLYKSQTVNKNKELEIDPTKYNINMIDSHTINEQSNENTEKTKTNQSDETILNEKDKPHSRKKRLIWVTEDGRLALPPGTSLSISPTIALPFVRYPPDGFLSNMTISLPLTIDFDKLGLTDNQNPLGTIPDYLGRSMGRAAGSVLGHYISSYLNIRKKRSLLEKTKDEQSKVNKNNESYFKIHRDNIDEDLEFPKLPTEHQHAFHGGERAILYTVVEDFLSNFGLDGKACLLRAICEVHSKPMHQLGILGEMLKLFFTASKSPFSEFLDEYISAEKMGTGKYGPGECFPYFKDCSRSIFKLNKNKYHNSDDLEKEQYSKSNRNEKNNFDTNEINSGSILM